MFSFPLSVDRSEVENPGTTLYVTGLSTRVTDKDLEAHFSKEGKVITSKADSPFSYCQFKYILSLHF